MPVSLFWEWVEIPRFFDITEKTFNILLVSLLRFYSAQFFSWNTLFEGSQNVQFSIMHFWLWSSNYLRHDCGFIFLEKWTTMSWVYLTTMTNKYYFSINSNDSSWASPFFGIFSLIKYFLSLFVFQICIVSNLTSQGSFYLLTWFCFNELLSCSMPCIYITSKHIILYSIIQCW